MSSLAIQRRPRHPGRVRAHGDGPLFIQQRFDIRSSEPISPSLHITLVRAEIRNCRAREVDSLVHTCTSVPREAVKVIKRKVVRLAEWFVKLNSVLVEIVTRRFPGTEAILVRDPKGLC